MQFDRLFLPNDKPPTLLQYSGMTMALLEESNGAAPSPELFYVEHNASAPSSAETIIFLHGAFSSHHEWDHVVAHLTSSSGTHFHILVPDLPQHGRSRATHFTLAGAADAVAGLIRSRARQGRAHVVGLSLGGFVGQMLVRRHADVARTLFATGAKAFDPALAWVARRCGVVVHWAIWAFVGGRIHEFIAARSGIVEHDALTRDMLDNNATDQLAKAVYGEVADWTWEEDVREVAKAASTATARDGNGFRILICGGTSGDSIPGTKRLAAAIRTGGRDDGDDDGQVIDCKSFAVRNAVHCWDLQLPELFARAVTAWMTGATMPSEFEALE
ncbi:3-oxoadipate enol-lactonase [Microdochium nivale]|nr:3-oxoadipate enol-lactonase [Microdochium nivale]